MDVHGQRHAPAELLPEKRTDTPCTEGGAGVTAYLNVRPVPSCYTICAVRSTVPTAYFVNAGHYAIQ
jgi:hypothetical protein